MSQHLQHPAPRLAHSGARHIEGMNEGSYIPFLHGCKLEEQNQAPQLSVVIRSAVVLFPAALCNSRQHEESIIGMAS